MRPNSLVTAFAAFAVCLVAAFLFLQPVFSNVGNWGLYDWDQHFFYHESPKISLLAFHQFPLWTPYYCGGNLLLANPQSPFLSPFFAFVLLFGSVVGLKLEALVYFAIGLGGMFLAARKLGCSSLASVFAAVAFMCGSWFAVRVVVGHTTFFPFALLPLVFLFYVNAASASALSSAVRWGVAASVALAVMFLSGGIYPFYAAVLLLVLYSVLDSVAMKKIAPVAAVAAMLIFAALLASVKLVPVVDFTAGVSADRDTQLTSPGIVMKSLLSRDQDIPKNDLKTGRDLVPESTQKYYDTLAGKLPWGWHEYSAYLGIIPLLLAALSIITFRKNWKLILAALFFLLLAFGTYLPFGLWQILRQLPFFSSLHGPSRFIIVFVFLVALLAAKSLSGLKISSNDKIQTAFVVVLVIAVAADLFLVSRPLLSTAFPLAPLKVGTTDLGTPEFIQAGSSLPELSQYINLQRGVGTLNCYERLHIKNRAIPQFIDGVPFNGFIGNAYIAETNESLNFTYFSPQKISLKLPIIKSGSKLIINENYYKGWSANVAGDNSNKAFSFAGLLAAKLSPADSGREIVFRFSSPPFMVGAIISLIAAAIAIVLFLKPNKAAAVAGPAAKILKKLESYVFRQS